MTIGISMKRRLGVFSLAVAAVHGKRTHGASADLDAELLGKHTTISEPGTATRFWQSLSASSEPDFFTTSAGSLRAFLSGPAI
jgi:hypothetical protein